MKDTNRINEMLNYDFTHFDTKEDDVVINQVNYPNDSLADYLMLFRTGMNQGVYQHHHKNIEMLFILENAIDVYIDQIKIKGEPGDIIIINSNQVHSTATPYGGFLYFCIILSERWEQDLDFSFAGTFFQSCFRDEEIAAIRKRIMEELEQKEDYYADRIKAYLTLLTTRLLKHHRADAEYLRMVQEKAQISPMKKAIEYIQANYNKKFTLDDLARHIGFSKPYLVHTFKKATGYTVWGYLNKTRCKNAGTMLVKSDRPVAEIAALCGFESQAYFGKIFKEITKMSPLAYRKSHQQ